MSKLRIGLIGVGYWGPNLARNLAELDDAEFVAVADLQQENLDKLQSRLPDIVTTTNYQDLFDLDLDAMVVATPPSTHYALVRECLENGLHVMVEKPFVLKSEDGEKLIKLAQQRDRVLMVGHIFEYNPAVRLIKEIIDSGELGEVYYIDAVRGNLGLFDPNINAMWDLAPHDISIILYLLGVSPISVSGEGGAFVLKEKNVHDVVYMHMNFPQGVRANVRLSWLDPNKTRRITIVGSKSMLVYDDVEPIEKVKVYEKGVNFEHSDKGLNSIYYQGNITTPNIPWQEPLKMECQHLVDCINNHLQPQSDGVSGLRVVQVLEAAEKSLQGGQGGQVALRINKFADHTMNKNKVLEAAGADFNKFAGNGNGNTNGNGTGRRLDK